MFGEEMNLEVPKNGYVIYVAKYVSDNILLC